MNRRSFLAALALVSLALVLGVISSPGALQYTGVNLAGAEFGASGTNITLPGTFGTQYTYPTQTEVDYFKSKRMNILRLCFRWERLQQATNSNFDVAESNRFNTFVTQTTAKGMYVILNPHNFARYYPDTTSSSTMQSGATGLIGSANAPIPAFADFWSRLATIYRTNDHVIFGLMNEPNSITTEAWRNAANAAIAAIRETGATNLILVPGNGYTGAWTWTNSNAYGTPNSTVMLTITDPLTNFAFEVHQYLDSNGSGGSTNIVNTNIGVTRLTAFTKWLKTNNRKGFLGEFAVANSTIGTGSGRIGDETLTNMLTYVQTNSDVWLGWTWWAAGPWWGNYMFTLEPNGATDRAAMNILTNFIPVVVAPPTISVASQNGNVIFSWPTNAAGYFLEYATNLPAPGWTSNTLAPAIVNGRYTVTNPIGSGKTFYRLKK